MNAVEEEQRAVGLSPATAAAHPAAAAATGVIRLHAHYADCGGLPGMLLQSNIPGAQPMVFAGYVWPFGIAGVWRPHHPNQRPGADLDWTENAVEPGGFMLWPADEGAKRAGAAAASRRQQGQAGHHL